MVQRTKLYCPRCGSDELRVGWDEQVPSTDEDEVANEEEMIEKTFSAAFAELGSYRSYMEGRGCYQHEANLDTFTCEKCNCRFALCR